MKRRTWEIGSWDEMGGVSQVGEMIPRGLSQKTIELRMLAYTSLCVHIYIYIYARSIISFNSRIIHFLKKPRKREK